MNQPSNSNTNKPTPIAQKMKRKVSDTEKSWQEHALKMHQSAPEHLENTAKFLGALVSICFTLLVRVNQEVLGMGTVSGLNNWTFSAIVLWFFCIVCCLLVFFPINYRYSKDSAQTIQEAHQRIISYKRWFLKVAAALFVVGILALVVGMKAVA